MPIDPITPVGPNHASDARTSYQSAPSARRDWSGELAPEAPVWRMTAPAPSETEQWFQLLLDSAAEGIYAVGPDGRCSFCNRACLRLLGYADPTELMGRPIHELIHHPRADGTACAQETCAIFQTGRGESGVRTGTEVFWRADGTSFPVEFRTHPIHHAGEVIGSVVTFLDTTERQRAENSVQMLTRAIEQTADSVFITNRGGVIEYVNPAFESLTGFSAAEAIGATPRLFKSNVQDARFFDNLWKTILSGQVSRFVVTNRSKDGRLYDEDQTITPIRDQAGTITHFVSTGRDITQRKRAEEALRRLNNQFELEAARIAGILHDEAGQFLTSAHMTIADIARDTPPPIEARLQQVRQHLEQVEAQLRRVSHEMHPSILDDLGLPDAIRFLGEAFARRTGIALTIEAQLETPRPPAVDAVLYRLVQEALTNMGKHARATAGTVVLRREGTHLRCSVHDNGAGFDVDRATAHGGARGLGLTLMRDRLEAVGGTLQIISAPGHGTELRTTIPVDL